MNHIYKKVWSRVRGCFVAVSEAMTSGRPNLRKSRSDNRCRHCYSFLCVCYNRRW